MKKIRLKSKSILVLLAFALCSISCFDPHEYEPEYPDLADPPAAPALISPGMNQVFETHSLPYEVRLEWQAITDAEDYRVEISLDSTYSTLYKAQDNIPTHSYNFTAGSYGKYYWRVRADSRGWKWYTEWSETNTFIVASPIVSIRRKLDEAMTF